MAKTESAESGKQSWVEGNVINPLANTAADAYNALFYNTIGKAANTASQAIADKDLIGRAERKKVAETEGLSKETVMQVAATGVGMALVYVAAGKSVGGIIRLGERALAGESKLASVMGAEKAAAVTKTMVGDKASQILGATAYDGLRDLNKGESHLGNMAGSLVAFGMYEKFNPKLAALSLGSKIGGYALLGSTGAGAAKLVADGISGHATTGSELAMTMAAGGAMNMALPGMQKLSSMGLGHINDKMGRGNPVLSDMQLNGLSGKSETLDELAGRVATLRVKTGQDSTNLQGKTVSLEGRGNAPDRAHEFAHEWFLKSHKAEFEGAAKLLRNGDEVKAFQEYLQLRRAGENFAHKAEAKVAAEVGDTRNVEVSLEKVGQLKTPQGITYDEQFRREFEKFKATDGRVVSEIDFREVPTIVGVESMREIGAENPKAMKAVMSEYYPKLKQAFPDKSEYEKRSTYIDYLLDKNGTWDAVALRGSNGQVIGGIQSQVIPVGGREIKSAVWGEHIWLSPDARSFPNFRGLMSVAADRFRATGSQVAFMEFNDRAKMSLQEMIVDAKGGLPTEAREIIWGRFANKGLNILHFNDGKVAPYAQPAMDGQEAVNYLTLALISLDGKNLSGSKMPTQDYMKLLHNAHATIVDPATDPTVQAYTKVLQARMAKGEDTMTFAKLADTTVGRIVNRHFDLD